MPKKIQLIIASTRQNRVADSITPWVEKQVLKNTDVDLELIDLKDVQLPFFDAATPPSQSPDESEAGKAWASTIGAADGYIFLTPEYNRSIPASLKNAIDYLVSEWKGKPTGVISYGWVDGGKAASAHLDDVLTWLKTNRVKTNVSLHFTGEMFNDNGFADIDASFAEYEAPLAEMLSQIVAAE